MNETQEQPNTTENQPEQTDPAPEQQERDTGPLNGFKSAFKNFFGGKQEDDQADPQDHSEQARAQRTKRRIFNDFLGFNQRAANDHPPQPERERSAIEKMRDKIADFDEDYKDIGERVLGGFSQFIGYFGPFLLMAWVGSDLGKFFAATMGLIPAYGLAFTIEGVIAACTVAMGRAFAEIAGGKANFGKTFAVVLIWVVLNSSSAFGLYLVITGMTDPKPVSLTQIEQFAMVIRVVAIALADLGCSAVLMFKGRSLQKHIESIRKRATAIGELADAQRGIEEADKNAALREQMMKATLQIQEDLSKKIGEAVSMVMTSILEKMEKALKEEDQGKNEGRYGRR